MHALIEFDVNELYESHSSRLTSKSACDIDFHESRLEPKFSERYLEW